VYVLFKYASSAALTARQGIFQDLEHGGGNQPLGVLSFPFSPFPFPSLPFPSLPSPLKPGGVVRKLGAINPLRGCGKLPAARLS